MVAPLAKELFTIDITGLEVKWGSSFENYYFIKDKKLKELLNCMPQFDNSFKFAYSHLVFDFFLNLSS